LLSENTQKLISEIQNFSGNRLKNVNDTGLLIELSDTGNSEDPFFDVLFISKFLYGSKAILSKENDIDKEKLLKEFQLNLSDLKRIIKEIIEENNEITAKFDKKYFELTQESMSNLYELISDLKICKDYFNSLKN